MRALSLFSGIGGIDLAAEWAGIETVAFCEREPFCQKVLAKHWPNIPIYDDVCTLTKERLEADGIDCGTIGLISAGYPCQPYSVAGEREGTDDDRALWPEVKRLLEEIRPRWFVGENVAGHVSLGLDGVLSDLEDIRYTVQPIIIPASAVGAVHRRDRIFILAHTNEVNGERSISEALQRQQTLQGIFHPGSVKEWAERSAVYEPKLYRINNGISTTLDGGVLTNAHKVCYEKARTEGDTVINQVRAMWEFKKSGETSSKFDGRCIVCGDVMQEMPRESRPRTGQTAQEKTESMHLLQQGIHKLHAYESKNMQQRMSIETREIQRPKTMASNRERNSALGNAVVPQQIYPILAAIKQIDDIIRFKGLTKGGTENG